ncbi:MAG: Secretory immunoglobulin A-binding protein EsiB [Chlamydiae bacterium]|nr:Secretory immunoglobulin A-binding protein EsiB [Chlamydiota bacterium]
MNLLVTTNTERASFSTVPSDESIEKVVAIPDELIRKAFREDGYPHELQQCVIEFLSAPRVLRNFADSYNTQKSSESNYEFARNLYDRSSSHGDYIACNILGTMYMSGKGGIKDGSKAFQLIKKSVALKPDYKVAIYNLGICYQYGLGVEINLKSARKQFKIASKGMYPPAVNQLSTMYIKGLGGKKKVSKGIELLQSCADETGDKKACRNLCLRYMIGDGVERDTNKARKYSDIIHHKKYE